MPDRTTEILLRATASNAAEAGGESGPGAILDARLTRLKECLDAEFVLLRSPVANVMPEHVAVLEALMDRHPDACMAALSFREENQRITIHAALDFPHAAIPARVATPAQASDEAFLAVWSPCMLVRTAAIQEVDLPQNELPRPYLWFELGLRAQRKGWTVRVLHGPTIETREPAETYAVPPPPIAFSIAWKRHLTQASLDRQTLALLRGPRPGAGINASCGGATGAPVRVLVDLARVAPGGATGGVKVFTIELLRAISESHHDSIQFLWLLPAPMASEALGFAHEQDEIWLLPGSGAPPFSSAQIRRLTQVDSSLARSLQADVLYAPLGVSDFRLPDIPAIGTAVDVLHRDMPDALPPHDVANRDGWFNDMATTDTLIQCISRWTAHRVTHHFQVPSSRIIVTYCAVQSRLRPEPDQGANPVFLYPANSWPHKNHKTLLEGFADYVAHHPAVAWDLVLTGHNDEAMQDIARLATALRVQARTKFLGYLDLDSFSRLWGRTGALVFPSLYEGFGIPLLEAMRLGVPILAGREGSIPEVAGEACLYVDVRDPASIAAGLWQIQTDESLRAGLIAKGRLRADRFTMDTEAARMARAFLETASFARAKRYEYYRGWVPPATAIDIGASRSDAMLRVSGTFHSAIAKNPAPALERASVSDILHHLDAPEDWSDPVRIVFVRGWCFATAGSPIVGVAIRVGAEQRAGSYGLPRPDVARHFNRPEISECGFAVAVPRMWCVQDYLCLLAIRQDGSIDVLASTVAS